MKKKANRKIVKTQFELYEKEKIIVKRKQNIQLAFFIIMCFICFITFALVIVYLTSIINNL
jgi:hypothetical protein